MRIHWLSLLTCLTLLTFAFTQLDKRDPGKPWKNKMQHIPGKVECEFYDVGGEGKAYHDNDSINNGSGKLNPVNGTYLNEFRMKEGVDISYTKPGNIDNSPFNKVSIDPENLYLGWTAPGEWINYSVKIKETSSYQIGVMYTANGDGTIALDLDGKRATQPLSIVSTHDAMDTIAWRQWHHWNYAPSIGIIELKKGVHVITIHILTNGNMNLDWLEFTEIKR